MVEKAGESKFAHVQFAYQDSKGKTQRTALRVQKGMVLDFKNREGYDDASYRINEKGQIVDALHPNRTFKEINTIKSEIDKYKKMATEIHDGGLTQQDYNQWDLKRVRSFIEGQSK